MRFVYKNSDKKEVFKHEVLSVHIKNFFRNFESNFDRTFDSVHIFNPHQ